MPSARSSQSSKPMMQARNVMHGQQRSPTGHNAAHIRTLVGLLNQSSTSSSQLVHAPAHVKQRTRTTKGKPTASPGNAKPIVAASPTAPKTSATGHCHRHNMHTRKQSSHNCVHERHLVSTASKLSNARERKPVTATVYSDTVYLQQATG